MKTDHVSTSNEVSLDDRTMKPVKYQSNPFYLCFEMFNTFFEKNTWWAVALLISGLLSAFVSTAGNFLSSLSDMSSQPVQAATINEFTSADGFTGIGLIFVIAISLILLVLIITTTILQVFIGNVFQYVALRNNDRHSVGLNEAFSAVWKRFPRLLLAQFLALLKIIAWSFLLIIPGIIAAYRYSLLAYVILDESETKKGISDSHERTKALIAGRKREAFGVSTVAGLLPIVGPLNQVMGSSRLYRQLQVFHDGKLQKPPVHWLNYLGFILVAFFGTIALIGLILIVSTQL